MMASCLVMVLFSISCIGNTIKSETYDICIYGASSAGVIAAHAAKMKGKTVLLIEPGKRIGGLSSGGLGSTDIGNKIAITGLSRDFYKRIGKHYGTEEQWKFEPKVALGVFHQYLKEARLQVLYNYRLKSVKKKDGWIKSIIIEQSSGAKDSTIVVEAKMFIDSTYEGDLMAAAGVSYTVGRESNDVYGETLNGVQLMNKHQFPDGVDPYKIPGKPKSGLLWGISSASLKPNGSGDKMIQAFNFRICLTDIPENRIAITKPEKYNPAHFELLLRLIEKKQDYALGSYIHIQRMPGGKTDINNNGAFSTDMIGANHLYAEANYTKRAQIIEDHVNYTKGLLYFLGNDSRVPDTIRKQMQLWGYPKDEYVDNNNFSPQLYIRESRRMVSDYVMTQDNCVAKTIAEDKIGMAAYTMDSHNCQRIVINGMVKNEGDVQKAGFKPYPIAYRSIIPKERECKNLLVPICLSASHIAFGSIRMEPVFMVLGESAAVAAVWAIDNNTSVQGANLQEIQKELGIIK